MRVERITWDGAERRGARRLACAKAAEPPTELSERVAAIIERVRARGRRRAHGDERRARRRRANARLAPGLRRTRSKRPTTRSTPTSPPRCGSPRRTSAPSPRPSFARRSSSSLPQGHEVSVLERPVASAGVYAPGGRAAYPSSVLMGLIPAHVAGVGRVVLVSPPRPDGTPRRRRCSPRRTWASADEVYAIGGAQAVAALGDRDRFDRPGRRHRRAGQRLGHRGEAPALRHRRHRRPGRALGARRRGRRGRRRAQDRPRRARAGRARPGQPDRHRLATRALLARRRRGRAGGARRRAALGRGRADRAGRGALARPRPRPLATPSRRSTSSFASRAPPSGLRLASPGASSSARPAPRRSATTPRGPTTSCPRVAQRASPARSALARSGGGCRSWRFRPGRRRSLPRRPTRSRGPRACRCTASRQRPEPTGKDGDLQVT